MAIALWKCDRGAELAEQKRRQGHEDENEHLADPGHIDIDRDYSGQCAAGPGKVNAAGE
jgi:hypothetical protein